VVGGTVGGCGGAALGGEAGRPAERTVRAGEVPPDDIAHDAPEEIRAAWTAGAGAGQRLTVVVGSAGAGKSVLLSSWVATREAGVTSWLSCDEADADPVRFWAGFIEAPRVAVPGFGADAGELLAMDGAMSADVTASIANAAARLPAGSAVVVDDFHAASAAAARNMTDLIERWPAKTAQLVLSSRVDPPLRLHRLRLSGELCELRDRDLYLSLPESRALLANFGVEVAAGELALLHQRSEGWVAALQMAALTLRGTKDPVQAARALNVRSHAIAEYFISEVLQQQPPEVARFMLDTSVLDELTAEACAAVTGRQDAAALLRSIDAANLFIVALDDERTSYRYHHLVRDVLRAELGATDRERELAIQLRAAEWSESAGDTRGATRHHAALEHLDALALGDLTPRAVLVRQILLAAAAIERGDPAAVRIVGGVLEAARHGGFLNTVVTTAPQVTRYLVEHSTQVQPEPFLERVISAALEVRAMQPDASRSGGIPAAPLTAAELRVLKLLPTTTYLRMAATLYISHNTVKTHLRSIYQKLGVSSRPEAIERAVDLRLL
jgi:LuxR family transcriptional regulator, maltose regulon positive regulatory protein